MCILLMIRVLEGPRLKKGIRRSVIPRSIKSNSEGTDSTSMSDYIWEKSPTPMDDG